MSVLLMVLVVAGTVETDIIVPAGTVPVMNVAQRLQRGLSPRPDRSLPVSSIPARECYTPGVVVVRFRPYVDDVAICAFCEREGVIVLKKGKFADYHVLGLPSELDVEAAVEKLSSACEVEFAEPEYVYSAGWLPNDPYYWSNQWNLRRDYALDMQLGWELTTGSSAITVAVVDGGVAFEDYDIPSHELGEVYSPDGRYHRAPDLASTWFVQGYDCVNDDWHANDEIGHGTHVAGTIAQSTNNGIGVAGMAFGCRIMPVRVLDEHGSGTETDIVEGIAYAWQNGANVINMSLGSADSSHLIHLEVIDAANAGAVVVAAAGNDNANAVGYPAAFPECIAVGAVDYSRERSYYSNWGSALDVVAPGGDARSQNYCPIWQNTFADALGGPPHDVSAFGYPDLQGTSMAAPHVSALVAMMMSRGIRDPTEIKQRLYQSAIDLGASGWDPVYGHGLIEPVAALGGRTTLLSYDNNNVQQFYYVPSGSERRFAVLFTPNLSSPFDITEGYVLVWDNGGRYNFRLTLNPIGTGGFPNMSSNLAGPVTFTTVGDSRYSYWYLWDFAGVTRTTSTGFFLVFHWVSPNFNPPYVGGDTTNINNRSYWYSSSGWAQTPDFDFYIRTRLLKDTLTVGLEEGRWPVAPVRPAGIVSVVPQPARKSVSVLYSLRSRTTARLQVVDCAGRVVRDLSSDGSTEGQNEQRWDCSDNQGRKLASGVYFIQLSVGSERYRARVQLVD